MQLIDYKVSQKLTAFYPMNLIYLESRSSRSIICFKFYIESITCTSWYTICLESFPPAIRSILIIKFNFTSYLNRTWTKEG